MTAFLALYAGRSFGEARLVAVTSDRSTIADFTGRLLGAEAPGESLEPSVAAIERGRRTALRLIHKEANDASGL